jgi:RNA polymerase sigma factor (sigma-70 family)
VPNGSNLISPVSRVGLRLASDERLVSLVRRESMGTSAAAFEALYERHVRGLLSFCVYMLGSRDDAEDAVQAAFAAAHRSLRSSRREVTVRPWLFAIARNECIDIIRKRRPTVELNGEPATTGDPVKTLALREEVRGIVEDVHRLPERQRAALVLAEVDGLSQAEIGGVLGVRAEQVKAYVYQARENLLSERGAREADCAEIREQLAVSRGPALRRARIRRHTRMCDGCRAYAESVGHQRRQLSALIPVTPTFALKHRVFEQLLGLGAADHSSYAESAAIGSVITGTIAEFAGGGMKALAAKIAAGVLAVGATAEVGASVLSATSSSHRAGDTAGESASQAVGEAGGRALATASVEPGARRAKGSRVLQPSTGKSISQPHPAGSAGGAVTPGPAPQPSTGAPQGQPAPDPATSTPSRPRDGGTSTSASGEAWSVSPASPARREEGAQRLRERELARMQRERLREERKLARGHEREELPSEEPPEVGLSGAPKKTPQERQELREERERKREERKRERAERQGE